MDATGWVRAHAVDDLPADGAKLFRHLDKRIALFRTPQGVFATDNRCPHQGYALVQGDVKEGVLTCAWHNWKFQLADGTCTFGGEAVRTYPVEIRSGEVWLDVTDPAAEEITPQLFASLLEAIGEVDVGRMARDAMRLQRVGVPLSEVIAEGVRYGAPRGEYGWNHSLATLTDCLHLAEFMEGPLKALPVLQGLSVISETEVRRPLRPRPEPVDPIETYGSIQAALHAYPKLVDEERGVEAEALLRGVIAAGAAPADIRHALLVAITDHFLGYGHPLIYCMKAFELLDQIGWHEADTILGPLAIHQVLSTRYDRLPYMARFLRTWKAAELDLADLLRRPQTAGFEEASFTRALIEGSPEDAFEALRQALETGIPIVRIIDATMRAASERFSRFDIDIDIDDTNEWGWLDVTHTLTYVNALRWAWTLDPSADLLRGLFHAVWFVQWCQQLDARDATTPPTPFVTSDATALPDAVRRRDPEAAVAIALGYDGPAHALDSALAQVASEDEHTSPIMIAHSVKVSRAAIVESKVLGAGAREPIAAAARFLASPKRQRFVFNATLEAVAFVQGRSRGDSSDA